MILGQEIPHEPFLMACPIFSYLLLIQKGHNNCVPKEAMAQKRVTLPAEDGQQSKRKMGLSKVWLPRSSLKCRCEHQVTIWREAVHDIGFPHHHTRMFLSLHLTGQWVHLAFLSPIWCHFPISTSASFYIGHMDHPTQSKLIQAWIYAYPHFHQGIPTMHAPFSTHA